MVPGLNAKFLAFKPGTIANFHKIYLQKTYIYGIIILYKSEQTKRGGSKMTVLAVIYLLIFVIFALIAYAILQIRLFGMKVKDFWSFIEANQMLDRLYHFAKQYERMSSQEQIIYLTEAEKIFKAFDKVPEELWEEEYDKYKEVLTKYKDIKMLRWASN